MRMPLFSSLLLLAFVSTLYAGDPDKCPMHAEHMKRDKAAESHAISDPEHGAGVDRRHDTLGMSHETTRHSFRLFPDGGAIELRSNDPGDRATVDAIRKHIREIASDFSAGDFSTPRFVHGHDPDGIGEMKTRRSAIEFLYQELPAGARIRIRTDDRAALDSVHAFLKFQVVEHRTSDSGKVEPDR